MIRYITFFAYLFTFVTSAGSQTVFFTDSITIPFSPIDEAIFFQGFYNLGNCLVAEEPNHSAAPISVTDMGYGTDGELYSYGLYFLTNPFAGLYRVVDQTEPDLEPMAYIGDFQIDTSIQALCGDHTGLLYAAGTGLSIYNISNQTFSYIGDLPADMPAQGDLTFYYKELYLIAQGNKLVRVDIDNPMNSTIVYTFPAEIPPLHGFATFYYGCTDVQTYVIGLTETGSTMYQMDWNTYALSEICDIDRFITGTAGNLESTLPPCDLYVDLDTDDSSGAVDFDYFADSSCVASLSLNISDTDVSVYSELGEVDSILVTLSDIVEPGLEYLNISNPVNISVGGIGTDQLVLYNTGSTTFDDFAVSIESITYQNDGTNRIGTRQISVQIHYWLHQNTSTTTIVFPEPTIVSSVSGICDGSSNGTATVMGENGTSPYIFNWFDGTMGNTHTGLNAGTYLLTLTDALGCIGVHSVVIPLAVPFSATIAATMDTVCTNGGELTATPQGGMPDYTFIWNNADTSETISNISVGTYEVTITDDFDCTATANYTLYSAPIPQTNDTILLCEGEVFTLDDIDYTVDTSFCTTYSTAEGCDSLYCVNLQFSDTVVTDLFVEICKGESYLFDGILLNVDTTLMRIFSNQNNCDSTVFLTLNTLQNQTFLMETICDTDTYLFGSNNLNTAGIYVDTLAADNGCDSIVNLQLNVDNPEVIIESFGSLCDGSGEISLSVSGFSDYLWSNGMATSSITAIEQGNYGVTVTNDLNCTATDEFLIDESRLEINTIFSDPTCPDESNGFIEITQVEGGETPYFYSLDGGAFSEITSFYSLSGATYTIAVEDINGCQIQEEVTLIEPTPLVLDLGIDKTIKLGDSIFINPMTNVSATDIHWQSNSYLRCDTCLQTYIVPLSSDNYSLTLIEAAGCLVSDDIQIIVDTQSDVFIPTAFSPNGDGINDKLIVYSDTSVKSILYFRVFNRWGNLLFEATNFTPNDTSLGWDGTYNGERLDDGVYIWTIEILNKNEKVKTWSGEVAIVR